SEDAVTAEQKEVAAKPKKETDAAANAEKVAAKPKKEADAAVKAEKVAAKPKEEVDAAADKKEIAATPKKKDTAAKRTEKAAPREESSGKEEIAVAAKPAKETLKTPWQPSDVEPRAILPRTIK
ncbi:MAG: hypothetical protein HQ582_19860, partial [Planctomycetes bacterium]|nr:hypothetical protein [Planctomycetota bacterium]